MQQNHDDEFFVEEVLRLLGENSRLRQKAQRLGADMCQLELQLDGLSLTEPGPEEQALPCAVATPDECCDSMYPVNLLKLANENSFLRSQIQIAEVELVQMELAVESRFHLEASDSESEDEGFYPWSSESSFTHFATGKTSLNLSKLNTRSEASSETASPKIKAVHCGHDPLSVRSKPESCASSSVQSKNFTRCRTRTNSSISTHVARTRKSIAQRNAASRAGPWERSMRASKASSFMGGKGAVAVDSSSSTFFSSLRS
ncbi:hypothetical protein BSKO_14029 [Bryopsis sp. KO-2023]|nr:hypothetical protein BSKO_14029 [Bryopsis sp. KO-2023]